VALIELVLLPGCGLYRADAVAWLWSDPLMIKSNMPG